ncbi:MFS transporter [Pseudoduganella namucuonensis]|uniref:Predicted arabinose efflux permease, MFS family n=1 Tax=Pseudoduganella namucuonensis TaxID=1035707 RepID=A0A1I7K0X6_9BURK|nr:MFS transporter [Pseudoduganella namucuonensis]SFU91072.1 Predicted arabinose efflux permease, MFS family [Pseudoduganella namucuonensis]
MPYTVPPDASPPAADPDLSALAPLRNPVYRMLWGIWLTANICMWMNDVAAAWMMTTLSASPLLVALVQSASTLPVFMLGLPSGALADILDRRRYFLVTQFWVAGVALLLCAAVLLDAITPGMLLALTFANGIGLAMRFPVFAAIVPELVPRGQLPAALALNGVAMNASRIAGPLIAGALIAGAGSVYVFVLNAALSLACGVVIMRWRREHVPSRLGRERLPSAIRVGVQYVRQSARLKATLLRTAVFYLHSIAVLALLPLVARALHGSGAGGFTLPLASMGGGAIAGALLLPRLRRAASRDALLAGAAIVQSLAMAAVATSREIWLSAPTMFCAGMAWIIAANLLTVAVQLSLPNWVRARGMSAFQMTMMGASAAGAALWGQVATVYSVQASLLCAAASGAAAMLLVQWLAPDLSGEEDLTPTDAFKAPEIGAAASAGHVQITVDYRIDPTRAEEFRALMLESRRRRLSQGALAWELLRDAADPAHYIERIVDESWTEHLRRFDRVTRADVSLRDRKFAYHLGPNPPLVTRCFIENLDA